MTGRPALIFPVLILLAGLVSATAALADIVVPNRTIPARAIITAEDLALSPQRLANVVVDPQSIIGKEARVALFAGRPIRPGDVGPPALVERNQIVSLQYQANGLMIATEGRVLERGGLGDTVRVMNIASRQTVLAQIGADGAAYVRR